MKNGSGVEADRVNGAWSGSGTLAGVFAGPAKVSANVMKRAMDLAMAIPVVIFVSPLLVLIAILIKLGDPGQALFKQRRCGADGALFECYKFRTMRKDAAERLEALLAADPASAVEWAKYQKLRHDPRVTALGRFLRKSSLDELPQLFNIIRGEMSVIGPRPITSAEIFRYGQNFHFYSATRPGVIGLWQVNGRNKLTYEQRVEMDIEYVRTWTIWSDVKILFKAIPAVLMGKGAY